MPAKLNPFPDGIPNTDDCLIWQGMKEKSGYGRWYVGNLKKKAHRVIYCQHHGIALSDIDGVILRHTCDNPPCVNPRHLVPGTQKQNVSDMYSRGRQQDNRGTKHHQAKLTDREVLEISAACSKGDQTQREIANRYEVSQKAVWCIANRTKWKHLFDGVTKDAV